MQIKRDFEYYHNLHSLVTHALLHLLGKVSATSRHVIESQIEHGFDQQHQQVAPLSMLIQLERAPELIDSINEHGLFVAEMKEWNAETHQAHIVVHPNQ
ncbi:DUF2913 family protein [Vibrio parahaemolyticus]|nr:DUF2913 family protein [Vibrio parahaemolyticus]